MNSENLTEKQKEAFELMKNGHNLFISGPSGTGKSYLIKQFKKWCYLRNKTIAITALTGISAIIIDGTTVHSFAGIGLGEDSVDILIDKINKNKFIRNRWVNTKVLVIDEVSMMKPLLFEKLEEIARKIRKIEHPFGCMQIILVGDFAQLPPVYTDTAEQKFCFESEIWEKIIKKTINLTEIKRQTEPEFQKCLNEARFGSLSQESIESLKGRIIGNEGIEFTQINGIFPTRLFSRKASVAEINNKKLIELKNKNNTSKKFISTVLVVNKSFNNIPDTFKENLINKIHKSCPAVNDLELVIDAQVMLIHNLDIAAGYVNGSRGVVVGFTDVHPIVRFLNGTEVVITPATWELKESEILSVQKTQIPLIIAYALTIHKAQGSTLDYVMTKLSGIFQYGQAYVALSRVRNLNGLILLDFDENMIKCHPRVLSFYDKLS